MNEQLFSLVDARGTALARVKVVPDGDDWLLGKIITDHIPEEVRQVFRWHEEVANENMLSFLDEAEQAISLLGLGVLAEDDPTFRPVFDLQIMNGDDVAFRLLQRHWVQSSHEVAS